jgi:hypothetical protein
MIQIFIRFFNLKPTKKCAISYSYFLWTLLLMILIQQNTFSQNEDFRGFYSVEVNREVFNLIDLSVAPEIRLENNQSQLETYLIDCDASVPVLEWLRLGALYRFQQELDDPDRINTIHRLGIFAKFGYRIKPFDLYYRCSYQNQYENIHSSDDGMVPKGFFRNKVKVTFNKKKYDFKPFASFEYYHVVHPEKYVGIQKSRLSFGAEYKFNKTYSASFAYIYQKEIHEYDPLTSHIIALSLNIDWK